MYQIGGAPLIAAVGASTDQIAGPYYSQGFKGITVVLDVTAVASASLTVIVEGFDQASGKYFPILTSGAITATGTTSHTIYAGLVNASGAGLSTTANNIMAAVFRIRVHVTGGTASFTVGAVLTT
jgi:hypothetical protein